MFPNVRHWQGVGDPAYLLHEIEELKAIADPSGLGPLAYVLELAAVEAKREVMLKKEAEAGENG